MEYRDRIVDGVLAARLGAAAAVVIEGARGSGKTASARRQARSEVRFDVDSHARALAELDPEAASLMSHPSYAQQRVLNINDSMF